MKLSRLKIDRDLATNGVWVEFAPGVEFLIARAQNAKYRAVYAQLSRDYADVLRNGNLDEDVAREIAAEANARAVLLGWRGVEDDEGNAIDYTWEKGKEVLADPAYEDIFDFVVTVSNTRHRYRVREKEEALGN